MTNDLIRRSALLGKAIRVSEFDEGGWERVLRAVPVEEIEAADAVDAAPVVHGRWIPNIREETRAHPPYTYQNGFKCSLCGRVTRSDKEPYCHCGARMD
jgi:hypothetical protein